MVSRKTEALIVLTCLFVLSVQGWFLVRSIAEAMMGHAEVPVEVAPVEPPPPLVVAAAQPAETTDPGATDPSAAVEARPPSNVERLREQEGVISFGEPREATIMNSFLWGVFPYICIVLFFAVPVIRMLTRPFSWSTRASGLFGRQLLGVASTIFHWGLVLVFLGHVVGLLGGVLGSSLSVSFFYWSGLLGGLMVLVGSVLALWRRITVPSVRAMSQPEDYIIHYFLIAIVGLALYQVLVHRIFGIAYGASSWAASLWTLSPQPQLMASASLITKLHVLLAMIFFAYFPFTKLVHFWTFPINYFVRPQLSMRTQRYRFQRRWEMAWRSDKSWLTYGLGGVAVIFIIAGLMLGSARPSSASGLTLSETTTEDGGEWLMGYPLYISQCARCHGVDGRGEGPGANSPTFAALPRDLVAARYHFVSTDNGIASDDDIYRTILKGLGNSGMPGFPDLTDAQILSLVDVLNDMRAGGTEPGNPVYVGTPPPATPESVARGRDLWAESCANCHGVNGDGNGTVDSYDYLQNIVLPADLAAGDIKSGSDAEQIYLRTVTGIPGGYEGAYVMLDFSRIPVEDQWALVHYLMEEIMPPQEGQE